VGNGEDPPRAVYESIMSCNVCIYLHASQLGRGHCVCAPWGGVLQLHGCSGKEQHRQALREGSEREGAIELKIMREAGKRVILIKVESLKAFDLTLIPCHPS
jgi:hypothetical protein